MGLGYPASLIENQMPLTPCVHLRQRQREQRETSATSSGPRRCGDPLSHPSQLHDLGQCLTAHTVTGMNKSTMWGRRSPITSTLALVTAALLVFHTVGGASANGAKQWFGTTSTTVTVRAGGDTGTEQLVVNVRNTPKATITLGQSVADHTVTINGHVSIQDIKLSFVNDGKQDGVDRNATIDLIVVNGITVQAERTDVIKHGAYAGTKGDCARTEGLPTERLACDGWMDFSHVSNGGTVTTTTPPNTTTPPTNPPNTTTPPNTTPPTVPPNAGNTATLQQTLTDDMTLAHEGTLDGVPSNWSWASRPQVGYGNTLPSGWNAGTAWGQVYPSGNRATNTYVNVANLSMAVLSKSTGRWTIVQQTNNRGNLALSGGYFDYVTNNSASIPPLLGDGTLVGAPTAPLNLHFFPDSRYQYDPADIAGLAVWFDARLVLKNPNGPDDRGQARFLAGAGGDFWANMTTGWQSWGTNGDFAIGRMRWVTNDWTTYTAHTLSAAQIASNPPPIPFSAGGSTSMPPTPTTVTTTPPAAPPTTTPPVAGTWMLPSGRPIKVNFVGDSITAGFAESPNAMSSVPTRLAAAGRTVTLVGTAVSGTTRHDGRGAWCIDDTNNRCTHPNGYHAGGLIQSTPGWLNQTAPDVIVVNAGTNDRAVQQPWTDEQTAAAMGRLIDTLTTASPNALILVTTITYRDGPQTNLNSLYRQVVNHKAAEGRHVRLIDMYQNFDAGDFSDFVHPTASGAVKMAESAAAELRRVLNDVAAGR